MRKHKVQWILGNAKLQKTSGGEHGRVIGFGIPADHDFDRGDGTLLNTCFGALACRGVCYAKQGSYTWPAVKAARLRALEDSLRDTFADDAIDDLWNMRGVGVVRIHDSGDFYSQEYLDKWTKIALACPNIIFYAYTKALTLDFTRRPPNLRITQSMGGKFDNLVKLGWSHARIFSTHEARIAAGYIDGNESDMPAINGETNIGLVYHGTRNLTASQEAFFS